VLAYPFRFLNNGSAALVADDTDESDAQQIAFLLLTRVGERPLAPEYGTPDPTYDTIGLTEADIAAAVAAMGPTVDLAGVTVTPTADGLSTVEITFSR
jgi:phage baseplate assembly protein W